MQVSMEKISNVERRLTVVVPASQVEAAYTKQIDQIAQKAKIKGFRPGKAPLSVIQQQFGGTARQDALSEVIQAALYEAIAKENLRPVSTPRIEPKMASASQALEFTATFEVLPDIEAVKFTMPSIEKLNVEITADDVERVIEQLRKQYTKWTLVDRAAQEKDRVVIDYYANFEGKSDAENKIENQPLELGSKMMLSGFEDGLVGAKAGEERTLNLHFPKDYTVKENAGKPIEFVVTVKQVLNADMPSLDEGFVKKLGVKSGSVEELKKQIKESLEHERTRLLKEKLKEQVFTQLLEQNPLEVPASMIARESKNIHDEVYPAHNHHDHHDHSAEEMAGFNDIAKKRVVLGLLISEYAKQSQLTADKAQVLARIQEIASVYENPAEVIQWLSSEERRGGIESQVIEDAVLEKLMSGIPTTEKTMSYAELKGIRI